MQLLFFFFVFISVSHFSPPNIFAQCTYAVNPVNSAPYTGTSSDFQNGYRTLYRDTYTDTTTTYFEGIGSHPGVDILKDKNGNSFTTNAQVISICEGTIERVTEAKKKNGGWGNSLTIRHDISGIGIIFSIYAHLDRFSKQWEKGDPIKFGEVLGFIGTTGKSTGIHLHFQIDKDINHHPFFPNRFPGYNDGTLEVNTPDSDNYVLNNTINPIAFVQAHQAPPTTEYPWPMFQHDPQHTGQNPYIGPQTNNLKWVFDSKIYTTYGSFFESQPAIGPKGEIYLGASRSGGSPSVYFTGIYAINPDGTLLWKYRTGDSVIATPAIALDGTIYFGSFDHNFYALNPDGTIKWKLYLGSNCVASPTIGYDGTIYVGADKLYAINPDGTIKWGYEASKSFVFAAPAFSSDGIIYAHTTGSGSKLYSLSRDGALKWIYDATFTAGFHIFPVIGGNGTIYLPLYHVGPPWGKLHALNPDGSLKWEIAFSKTIQSPAIGPNETLYISEPDRLNAINPDGILRWQYTYGTEVYIRTPIIGADGTIYIIGPSMGIEALNPNGTVKWSSSISSMQVYSLPAISSDGTLLFGSDSKLYAFGD